MNVSEINRILSLLEEWVYSLKSDELSDQCRASGRDFFAFMQARGVNAGYMAKLITQVTGYNPAKLWRVEDAQLLRDAIFRYEGAQAVTRIEEREGTPDSAQDNLERFWK